MAAQVEEKPVEEMKPAEELSPTEYGKMVSDIENLIVGIVHPPKLLDWFVGLVAITWGVSLLLSLRTSEYVLIGRYANWFLPVMICAIASGAGVIIAEMRSDKISPVWKRIFLFILAVVFAGMSLILFRAGDIDGVLIYGLISLIIFVLWLAEPGSRILYMILVQGLFLGLLLGMRYFPNDVDLSYFNKIITGDLNWVLFIWFFNLVIYVALSWFGYYRKRILLSILLGLTAIPLVLVALAYGNLGEWSKAFLFLMIAVFGLLVPFWEELKFRYRKYRTLVYRMFGVLLAFFVGTAVLIWVVQTILINNATLKIADQVTYGKILSESALETATSQVEGLAQNAILTKAMETGKPDDVLSVIQGVFAGSRNLRQIVVADKTGKITAVYPLTSDTTGSNIANQIYFSFPIDNGRTYLPQVFAPAQTLLGVDSLPIAAPIFGTKRAEIGVLIGFFDLRILADRLAQVATPKSGQYFGVMDKSGIWMVNPDSSKINTKVTSTDPSNNSLTGKTGVVEGPDAQGSLSLIAFTQVAKTNWGLVLIQPLYTALSVSQTAYVAILAVASISVVIIGLTVLPRKTKEEINEAA